MLPSEVADLWRHCEAICIDQGLRLVGRVAEIKCSTRLSNQTVLRTRMRSRRIATARHYRRDRACVCPAIRDGSGASAPAPANKSRRMPLFDSQRGVDGPDYQDCKRINGII